MANNEMRSSPNEHLGSLLVGAFLFLFRQLSAQDISGSSALPPAVDEHRPTQSDSSKPKNGVSIPKKPASDEKQKSQVAAEQLVPIPLPAVPLGGPGSFSTAAVSPAPFAPGFFGDFLNSGGSTLLAPGAVLTPSTTDPNWSPLALRLLDSHGHTYFRSIDINQSLGFGYLSNPSAFGTSPQYQVQNYVTNGGVHYSSGYTLYNSDAAGTFTGNGAQYFSTFDGNSAVPGNVVLVSTESMNRTVYQQIHDPTQFKSSTTNVVFIDTALKSTQEIKQLSGNGPTIILPSKNGLGISTGYSTLQYSVIGNTNPQTVLFTTPAYIATHAVPIDVISPSVGANGVQKLVDNSSPLPRDRMFFNYSYFNNATDTLPGNRSVNLQRVTPGFEKTFFDQRMSIEVRVPFATTIDNINLTGATNTNEIQLGNQTTYLKGILFSDQTLAITSGLGVQLPTASNLNMYSTPEAGGPTFDVLQVKNQAVHLLPFLGAVYTPNDRFYAQSVAQLDFDANGNAVRTQAIFPSIQYKDNNTIVTGYQFVGNGLTGAGSLNDTNFLYLSGNTGYWIYKINNMYERGLTGICPTAELHYNQSMQRSDVVAGGYGNVSNSISNISNVNGVVGVNTVFGHDKYLSVAYVMPITNGINRYFDGELRVLLNYHFGKPQVNPRFSNVPGL